MYRTINKLRRDKGELLAEIHSSSSVSSIHSLNNVEMIKTGIPRKVRDLKNEIEAKYKALKGYLMVIGVNYSHGVVINESEYKKTLRQNKRELSYLDENELDSFGSNINLKIQILCQNLLSEVDQCLKLLAKTESGISRNCIFTQITAIRYSAEYIQKSIRPILLGEVYVFKNMDNDENAHLN